MRGGEEEEEKEEKIMKKEEKRRRSRGNYLSFCGVFNSYLSALLVSGSGISEQIRLILLNRHFCPIHVQNQCIRTD